MWIWLNDVQPLHSTSMKECTEAHKFHLKAEQLRHEIGDVGLNLLRSVWLSLSATIVVLQEWHAEKVLFNILLHVVPITM